MSINPLVTILINGHNEAELILRTLKSVNIARNNAQSTGITCDVVVVLDSADNITKSIVSKHNGLFDFLYEVNFADLGESRNFGIEKSNGKFISFIDGDDIMDPFWITKAYREANSYPDSSKIVFHTDCFLGFGDEWFYRMQVDSQDSKFSSLDLITKWFFCNNIFANRSIYLRAPLKKLDRSKNWGGEDWLWSCDSLINGIRHVPVRGTFYFYRRRNDVVSLGSKRNVLVPESELFSPSNQKIWNLNVSEYWIKSKESITHSIVSILKKLIKKPARLIYRLPIFRSHGFRADFSFAIRRVLILPKLYLFWRKHGGMVDSNNFKIDDSTLQILGEIEPQLQANIFRSKKFIEVVNPIKNRVSYLYLDIVQKFPEIFEHEVLIFAPWIKPGGADLMTLFYAKSIQSAQINKSVSIVTTEPTEKIDSYKIENINVIPIGSLIKKYDLSREEELALYGRLLVQSKLKFLWLVNSAVCHEVLQNYSLPLHTRFKIFVSVYGPGIGADGLRRGYAYSSLPYFASNIDFVITDNKKIISEIVEKFKFDVKKFKCIYAPYRFELKQTRTSKTHNLTYKILWAGRLDYDKRPDILLKIASRLSGNLQIDVYGSRVLNDIDDTYLDAIQKHPKINYKGKFENFNSINHSNYDLFLYTSNSDGLPNILIEAGCFGLPIVASEVGGVAEIIQDETGYPVENNEDPDEYLYKISKIYENYNDAIKRSNNLTELLRTQHSPNTANFEIRELFSGN